MSDLPLSDVLSRYQSSVEGVIRQLEALYGKISLDRIWAEDVPGAGQIGMLQFHFHGTGCTAHTPAGTVAWDWDEKGGLSEIQAWKLWLFTRDHPETFGRWSAWDILRDGLAQLVAERVLENVDSANAAFRLVRTE